MNSNAKQIARKRVHLLFQQAKLVCKTNPKLAQRYVTTARKIAMAARLRLPVVYRRQMCKNCNSLLVPGHNCRVRVNPRRETHVVVTCLDCGHQKRLPVKEKRRKNQSEQNNKQNETSRQA